MKPIPRMLLIGSAALGTLLAANALSFRYFCRIDDIQTRAVREMSFLPSELSPLQILVLGDSTAAFNLNAASLGGAASLGMVNGTVIETYYIFRRFLVRHPAPRCVLVSISFQEQNREQLFWNQFVKNDFFSAEELREIYRTSQRFNEFPSSSFTYLGFQARAALHYVGLLGISFSGVQEAIAYQRNPPRAHEKYLERMRKNRGPVAPESKADLEGGTVREMPGLPSPSPQSISYFQALLDLAAKAGSKVILLQPVFSSTVPEADRRLFIEGFRNLVSGSAEGRAISWAAPSQPKDEEFVKSGHLLARGARILSAELGAKLSECRR